MDCEKLLDGVNLQGVPEKKLHKVYAPQFCNHMSHSCAVFSKTKG